LLKTDFAKLCYKFCWQKRYKFNTEFDSDDVDNMVADKYLT